MSTDNKALFELLERMQTENRELFEHLASNLTNMRERLAALEKAIGGASKRTTRSTNQTAASGSEAKAAGGAKTANKTAKTADAAPFPKSTPNWFKQECVCNEEFRKKYLSDEELENLIATIKSVGNKKTRPDQIRAAAFHLWKSYDDETKKNMKQLFVEAEKAHKEAMREPALELDTDTD